MIKMIMTLTSGVFSILSAYLFFVNDIMFFGVVSFIFMILTLTMICFEDRF
jgi:hypothetical protein